VAPLALPAIQLLYGREFDATAGLLIVLVWSEVPIFFTAVLNNALVAKNLQKHILVPAIVGAVMNILLNLWAIPRYGALGASWATVASYGIGTMYFLCIREVRPLVMPGIRAGLWPFALAIGIGYSLSLFAIHFWWKLALGAFLYLAGARIVGAIRESDIEKLSAMLRGEF
jgi:O-antigen/teichoic acid export membrane protein